MCYYYYFVSFKPDVADALNMSNFSNTEAVLFACLWPAGPPQRVDCSQGRSNALPHWKSNQRFATFRLLVRRLYQLSHAATCK